MDSQLIEIQKQWTRDVVTMGLTEANLLRYSREIDYYLTIGLMRDGSREEWTPGKWVDSRVGALPTMWRRMVMDAR